MRRFTWWLRELWASRLDVPMACGDAVVTVSSSLDPGGVYQIAIRMGPRDRTVEVKARWYDNPTTIAWKLRRALKRAA